MRLVFDLVDTRALIQVARERQIDTDGTLAEWLPSVNVADVQYRVVEVGRNNRAAAIRAFDTPAQIAARPGATERRGGLPAISHMLPLSESERMRLRRLAGIAAADDEVENAIFNDADIVTQNVNNRVELLRGEALSTGQNVINEGHVRQTVQHGIPGGNLVAAATAWTDPAADIYGDLSTWQELYVDSDGEEAGVILTSRRVLGLMLRNETIRQMIGNNTGTVADPGTLNNALAARGLPTIRTYDRKVEDAAGVAQRVIAQNRLLLLPTGGGDAGTDGRAIGETQFGITEEAGLLAGANPPQIDAEEAPGLVAVTLVQDHPVLTATLGTAIALPVIGRPKAVVSATVF